MTTFLQKKSKRPRGPLKFVFNNAIEHLGGGQYNPEHGGYEQTNGRALNSLKTSLLSLPHVERHMTRVMAAITFTAK